MKYYPHHIGDFNNATRHLTRLERSVYRDMIDFYYDTEQPLPLDIDALCRKIIARSNEERTAVEQVLNEFFNETEHGWYNGRCEDVIEEYRNNTSQKSAAGKASAAKRASKKQRAINGSQTSVATSVTTHVEQACNGEATNQEPITNNQEPITSMDACASDAAEKPEYPAEFEQAWSCYPKRAGGNSKKDAFKAWSARIKQGVTADVLSDGVKRYAAFLQATGRIGTEYVKQASSFFGPGEHYAADWTAPARIPERSNGRPSINAFGDNQSEFEDPFETRRVWTP